MLQSFSKSRKPATRATHAAKLQQKQETSHKGHPSAGQLKIPVTNSAKCLGALWCPNLSCKKWVESNIEKARRAFFARGSGVFLGKLNPLSSRNIIEHCVLPCLLYGAESWILNNALASQP